MKSVIILMLLLTGMHPLAGMAADDGPIATTNDLKREIASILKNQKLDFLEKNVELVKVEFLINAKNELVVLHVEGENESTCNHVKKILGYQEVRYQQPRQLMRYKVELRLVKS